MSIVLMYEIPSDSLFIDFDELKLPFPSKFLNHTRFEDVFLPTITSLYPSLSKSQTKVTFGAYPLSMIVFFLKVTCALTEIIKYKKTNE